MERLEVGNVLASNGIDAMHWCRKTIQFNKQSCLLALLIYFFMSHIPCIAHYASLLSRLPRWIPRPYYLTSRSKPYPCSTPILTIPAQISILVYIPSPVSGAHASLFDARRGGSFGRFLRFLPFLLTETIEFHLAREQRRWLCERWLLGWYCCSFRWWR